MQDLPDDIFGRALRMHQSGQVQAAVPLYERLLADCPDHDGAWHLLGVACQQTGQMDRAIACLERALSIDSAKAVYYNNYGVALHALERYAEARLALERAVALNPRYADARSNLGLVLSAQGEIKNALHCYRQALALKPGHAEASFNLANLLHESGRTEEAISRYRDLLVARPDQPGALKNLGNALLTARREEEAVACYLRAITVNPNDAVGRFNLGVAYSLLDRATEAESSFAAAARLRPDKPLWRLRPLSLCPAIFQSSAEIDAYRAELGRRLYDACLAGVTAEEADLVHDAFVPPFNLAHLGRNNKDLLTQFAALFAPLVRRRPVRPRPGKPRIGFVVTAPHAGSFLRTLAGTVEKLDASRFEVVVCCPHSAKETLLKNIRREAEFVCFPNRLGEAADAIAAAGCRALYFHKVSADPLGYLLPFARLAPVQCTSWMTHYTSGVAEVDYYLSSELVEAEDADSHYSEKLVRMTSLPTWERNPGPPPTASRADFGLPERGGLYLCPQRLGKFHPDQDPLFRQVLEEDSEGHLVLLAGRSSHTLQQLLNRFERTLGSAARRVIVLPSQSPQDLRRLLSAGDVLLDIHSYSACLLGYDALGAGLPIATLPGPYQVQRYALGFYRQLDLTEAVADTAENYVKLAIRFGQDRDFRESFKARLAERRDRLFDDSLVPREYERFFEKAIDEAPAES